VSGSRVISHITLAVSDLERSTAFYNKVFQFIGFRSVEVLKSTQQAMKTQFRHGSDQTTQYRSDRRRASFARKVHDRNA
jgi:catechol 2,3-dioxygenase-like lactoylglutathione lyase family enzyme